MPTPRSESRPRPRPGPGPATDGCAGRSARPTPSRAGRAGGGAWRPITVVAVLLAACGCGSPDAGDAVRAQIAAAPATRTPVRFVVDAGQRFPISRYIYGINMYGAPRDRTAPEWPRGVTLSRFGGNRLTAYNWENNASNAGADWSFHNDLYLGGGTEPGAAARVRVEGALARGAGIILTVPILGHVARDVDGTPVGTDPARLRTRLAARFLPSLPTRSTGSTAADADAVDVNDQAVYQDEFVRWIMRAFPRAQRSDTTPIWFGLDNEPDIWGATHEALMPQVDGRMATQSYDAFIDRTIAYARAIKAAAPEALVFGPSTATWLGITAFHRDRGNDPRHGRRRFVDVYLERLREAERATGRRLLDVLDVHWYPETVVDGQRIIQDMAPQGPAMVEARLQAPRTLWDPTYDEGSWVTEANGGPVRLIPYLRETIAAHYPGTKLAISEYFYGRGGDIAGGIAQADVLGILGRERVFAATMWPTGNADAAPYGGSPDRAYRYIVGAFRMYRDYDGRGGAFGSVGLAATTSDVAATSVYASTDPAPAARTAGTADSAGAAGVERLVLVAINKRGVAREAAIEIRGAAGWRHAEVYTLSDAAPAPRRAPDLPLGGGPVVRYTMPPMSVTTLVLRR